MNIIVLLKQVVDVDLNLRVKDGALVEDGLNNVISNWDQVAIEAALQLIETVGSGEVTLVSIGPERNPPAASWPPRDGPARTILARLVTSWLFGQQSGMAFRRKALPMFKILSGPLLLGVQACGFRPTPW